MTTITKLVKILRISEDEAEVRAVPATLDGLKDAIGGGWLELIGPTQFAGVNWGAYVDEDGLAKRLPVNTRATVLARHLGWNTGDVLCGTVVFLGPGDDEGEDTDVQDGVLAAATTLGLLS